MLVLTSLLLLGLACSYKQIAPLRKYGVSRDKQYFKLERSKQAFTLSHKTVKLHSTMEENVIVDAAQDKESPDNGPDFTHMSWTKQWYPLMVDVYSDKSKPHPHILLGKDIVLWHDGKKWNAFENFCPHRGVPLSEGRVEKNGNLLCAYHAWQFDGSGQCTSIPQTVEENKANVLQSKTCVKSHPVQVAQGLIWVWGEAGLPGSDVAIEAALKQPRLIEELSDPKIKSRILPFYYNFRDLPYGNVLITYNCSMPLYQSFIFIY